MLSRAPYETGRRFSQGRPHPRGRAAPWGETNGDGYLMVGEDGGIFNFSSHPFSGSLGNDPPARPIVAVGAMGR